MKNLLFISWDSDQSNYMESLFFPILEGLQNQGSYDCATLQFSWADKSEVNRIANLAKQKNLKYWHFPVSRSPHPSLGVLKTIWKGKAYIKQLVLDQGIDLIMPRSTMPAWMVNQLGPFLKQKQVRIIFDADGLPIEERVDYSGLQKGGFYYRILKNIERKQLSLADRVITRSQKAIDYHLENNPDLSQQKFRVVNNGRDSEIFYFDPDQRAKIRKELGLAPEEWLWVYTGSLGPAYAWEELCHLLDQVRSQFIPVKLLVLSRNDSYARARTPSELLTLIYFKRVPFEEIPAYLSAGDLGISLRRSAPSLIGLAPIKLGEYFLCGLPVLASTQPGDTEILLQPQSFVFLTEDPEKIAIDVFLKWGKNASSVDREEIRGFGLNHFSLATSISSYWKALDFADLENG